VRNQGRRILDGEQPIGPVSQADAAQAGMVRNLCERPASVNMRAPRSCDCCFYRVACWRVLRKKKHLLGACEHSLGGQVGKPPRVLYELCVCLAQHPGIDSLEVTRRVNRPLPNIMDALGRGYQSGYVSRAGKRGSYCYTLTEAGQAFVTQGY
jgi:hypothetical protein